MMKKILLLTALLTAGVWATYGQTQAEKNNASKMIDLTNSVIDISNQYSNNWRHYQTLIEKSQRWYDRYSENYDERMGISLHERGSFPIGAGAFTKYEKAYGDVPNGMKGKTEIGQAVTEARATVAKLDEWGPRIIAYFEETRFTEDNFEGFQPIQDSLIHYYEAARNAWRNAARLASDAGEEAENLLLKGSPAAEFIIPMKTDLSTLKNLINDYYQLDGDEDHTPLKVRLEALNADVAKNKSLEGKNTSAIRYPHNYTSYYEKVEKACETLGLILDEIIGGDPDWDKVENYGNRLDNNYDYVVRGYNNFRP